MRWAARGNLPLEVRGRGLIDCELYRQPGRLILHLVNLTSAGTWRPPVDELIPVGPFQIRVRLPEGVRPTTMKRLVSRDEKSPLPRVRAGLKSRLIPCSIMRLLSSSHDQAREVSRIPRR